MDIRYIADEKYRDQDSFKRGFFFDWCTVENLDETLEKLKGVVGERWVTNDLTIRSNYSRDQSTVKQVTPHIVVLPSSTEEVSGVMKIAFEHKVPVTVGSCRINQGGECIPRRGGIVMDLVRMDRILEFNEENMYAVVQPFVCWGQLQVAGEQFGYWEGRALHGCEPWAPASASVMGNTLGYALSKKNARYGAGQNRIVSMTVVMYDGTIINLGSEAVKGAGKLGGAHGPRMDIARLFGMGRGRFGICTELAVEVFPWGRYRRYYFWASLEKNRFGHLDWFYQMNRCDLLTYFQSSDKATACHMITRTYEEAMDFADLLPNYVYVGMVQADTMKELDAKSRVIERITRDAGGDPFLLPINLVEGMLEAMSGLAQGISRKTRESINYMRQTGTCWYSASMINPSNAPQYTDLFYRALRQHKGERDPWAERDARTPFKKDETEPYFQPYFFGRNVLFEFDYLQDHSNPHDLARSMAFVEQASYDQFKAGMTGGWRYAKSGSPFEELEFKLKEIFDPGNILNPDYYGEIEDKVFGKKAY